MIELIQKIESFLQVSKNGYPEHFIGGFLIAVIVSTVVFKKTNMILTALFFGIFISSSLGLIKELIDPYIRGDRDKLDLIITSLGGILGAISFLFYRKRREKKILN